MFISRCRADNSGLAHAPTHTAVASIHVHTEANTHTHTHTHTYPHLFKDTQSPSQRFSSHRHLFLISMQGGVLAPMRVVYRCELSACNPSLTLHTPVHTHTHTRTHTRTHTFYILLFQNQLPLKPRRAF